MSDKFVLDIWNKDDTKSVLDIWNKPVSAFDSIYDFTLGQEGGFTVDHAGKTNRGVTQFTYDAYRKKKNFPTSKVEEISPEETRDLYQNEFYLLPKLDKFSPKVAGVLFDYGVNSSPKKAVTSLQKIVGIEQDGVVGPKTIKATNDYIKKYGEKNLIDNIITDRKEFYKTLIQKNPTLYQQYEKGWQNRIINLREKYSAVNPNNPDEWENIPPEMRNPQWGGTMLAELNPFAVKEAEAAELRPDGTLKGKGFFGELKRLDGGISTEISIGVNIDGKETQIPTLVPTLTEEEKDYLLGGNKPTQAIVQKAIAHAKGRIAVGKSPFAQEEEQITEEESTSLQTIAKLPGVSHLLDFAEKIMPLKEWEKLRDEQVKFAKNIPGLFFGATQVPLIESPEMVAKKEKMLTESIATTGEGILKTIARIPEAARGIIGGILDKKPAEGLFQAGLQGFFKPEEVDTLTSRIPFQEQEQGAWYKLIPRATAEAIETMLIYNLSYGDIFGRMRNLYREYKQAGALAEFDKMTNQMAQEVVNDPAKFKINFPKEWNDADKLGMTKAYIQNRLGTVPAVGDAFMERQGFLNKLFREFKSERGELRLPKFGKISVFKQPLTQHGFIVNLIDQGKKIPQDLLPVLGEMISEQHQQIGMSIFEPDTGDVNEMVDLAAKGELQLNKSPNVFSEEAHKEFYPPEEYAKVEDYAQLQQGGGIMPQDKSGKELVIGDSVKVGDKLGVIQDIFDDGTAQLKTIVGLKEVPMGETSKVKLESLTKKEQGLVESIKGAEAQKPPILPQKKTQGETIAPKAEQGLTLAIKLKNGTIISDKTAKLHSDIITNKGINPDDVQNVGILDNKGKYQAIKFPEEKGGAPLKGLPEVPQEAIEKVKGMIQKEAKVKEIPSLISKEELTSEVLDKLFVSERQIVTKRVLEGKSIKQTAKELGEDPKDVIKSKQYLTEKIPEVKTQLEEARLLEEEKLAEEFEREMASETDEVKKQLKGYLAGKLKFNLKSQGEYENLRLLNWLFAKEGERGYTPDELVGELKGMGFQVESDDDVRKLIKDYFSEEIWEKAERAVIGIEKKAKAKLQQALNKPPSERKKISDEMRLEKLNVIAEQLTKLAEIAPKLITPKQIAYIHVLKEKNLLSDQQFARLKKIFTGKKSLKVTTPTGKLKKEPVTKEEARALAEGMKGIVPKKPIITGQPPVIPRTKALVPSEWSGPFKDLTDFQAAPLSGLDPVRVAELVDGKSYGVIRRTIVEPARKAERQWKLELKNTLDNLTKISKGIGSKSEASKLIFKYIEKTLTPEEEVKITDTIRQTATYMSKVYDSLLGRINEKRALLNKMPIQKRVDYVTHIWELSLLDEFYQGLSNIPDDVVNVPSFAKSNSPFFKYALARLGGKEFELDAIAAFESYVSRAYPVIHNTDVLKSARPLVNRLPHNAYRYFTQYLDETMALRPSQADKMIPRPLLKAISFLRRQMGKGAILGNFASAFNQLFTLPNIVSAVGPKWSASSILKMSNDNWRAFTEANSTVLQGRIFEIDFDPTMLSKVDECLGFLIHIGDREMVRWAFGAAFEKAIHESNMDFEEAVKYADEIAFKTQSGFNITDLPTAFRSRFASSFLQFQNTVNNGLNYLRFDIGKEKGERGKWGVFKAGLLWLGTLLALNKIYRELGIPTPIDEWTDIFPLISMAEYGPPVTYSVPTAILQWTLAKTPQDKTKAARALYKSAFLFLPAGNQVRKTLEGIYAASKGGKFDNRGRLLFPVTGLAESIRAVLFGPYGTKKGQAYIRRGFKPESSMVGALKVWNE